MLQLFIFIMISVSVTNILVNSELFDSIRERIGQKSLYLQKLLSCMMCLGFWVGIVCGYFFPVVGINLIGSGLVASIGAYTYAVIVDSLNKE